MASGRFLFSAVLPHSRERQEQDEHTAANKQLRVFVYSFNGGIEGSRTPVRKKFLTTFYERSYLFILCAPTGNNTLRFEKALLFMTGYKAVYPCTFTAQ